MNKQAHNDQTMTQYLLGALPEAEVERLDEQSFTDDDFAAALQAAEKDLVDAYVQGELSGMALEKFKAHYLASARRREQVEFAQAFQFVAKKNGGLQPSAIVTAPRDKAAAKRQSSSRFFSPGWLVSTPTSLRWGAAFAVLLLLVVGSWLVFENARLRGQVAETQSRQAELKRREQELQGKLAGQSAASGGTEQEVVHQGSERERLAQEFKAQATQSQQQEKVRPSSTPSRVSVASFILTSSLRGAEQLKTLSLPPKTESVSMQLRLEPNDFTAYRVTLINLTDNQILWHSGLLKARGQGASKSLGLHLRANMLHSQAYALRVAGINAAGASENISDYPFRVMK
jgi:hypothetical protein